MLLRTAILKSLPLHLMAALLEDREGVVIPVLDKIGVPVEQLLSGINPPSRSCRRCRVARSPGLGQATQKVLEQAFKEADNFKDEFVSTEHLLLALSRTKKIRSRARWPPSERRTTPS